jgi:hypothetical protein
MRALPTTSGIVQTFLVAATNSGDSTYAPDGLAAAPIFGLGGTPLQGNELVEGGVATLNSFVEPLLNAGNLCWVLLECTNGAQQVGDGIGSEQAATVGQVQTGALITTAASGTANALSAAIASTLTALADGQPFTLIANALNSGAVTLALSLGETALQTLPVVKGNGQTLVRADIPAAGYPIVLNFSAEFGAYVMQNPVTGISVPVAVVGDQRNLKATVSAASTSITFMADQIVVAPSLNGVPSLLANFNQTFDGTKTGVGGMDTGSLPVSGFVAFYAALTASGQAGIFGTNASSLVGNVYVGTNLPNGVVATALVGVWRTDPTGKLGVGKQRGRRYSFPGVVVFSTQAVLGMGVFEPISVAPFVPPNAVSLGGVMEVRNLSTNSSSGMNLASDSLVTDAQICGGFVTFGSSIIEPMQIDLETPQILFFSSFNQTGEPAYDVQVSSYSF